MSNELTLDNSKKMEQVLLHGDLSKLNPQERTSYYLEVCKTLGLNPTTKPFEFITLNGKMVLYAKRECTEQLRQIHKVSLNIVAREKIDDVYVVTARAKTGDREDESTGAVSVAGLRGDALANAYMKAETKAKRRVTLSICGLALLDETEVGTIPGAKHVEVELSVPTPIQIQKPQPKPEEPPDIVASNDFAPGVEIYVDENWVIPHGTHKGMKLKEKSKEFWAQYVLNVKKTMHDNGSALNPAHVKQAEEIVHKIETYLS